jgi:hypothetical protein
VAILAVVVASLAAVVFVQAVTLCAQGCVVAWQVTSQLLAALGGIATAGTLLVAWLVYRRDQKNRANDERHRETVERRRQAELLSGWFINIGSAKLKAPIPDGTVPGTVQWDPPREVVNHAAVGLINASQVVVYDLIVAAICGPHQPLPIAYSSTDIRISEPVEWNEERDRLARGRANVLPPGQWTVGLRLATASLVPTDLHLFFRDHQGAYWWRNATGKIAEMPPPDGRDPRSRDRQIAEALGVPTDGRVRFLVVKPLDDRRAT